MSINDLYTLAVLLLRSPDKEWETLNLAQCNIDDCGCNILCKLFHSQRLKLKIKKVDISHNKIHWESLSSLCRIFKLWQTEELIISIDALYDKTTMNTINSFTDMFHKAIHVYFTGKLFSAMALCTYMAKQQRMIVVYSEPRNCIRYYQLTDCKLTDRTITKLRNLLIQRIDMLTINQITFIHNISCSDATMKSTMLSCHIQKVAFCGSNMHSKGAYLMNIPATIQCNDKPHQIAADYLIAVLCHNIQARSSYQRTVSPSLAIPMNGNLQHILSLRIFDLASSGIGKEAAIDIAAVLSHNAHLQVLQLANNNLQTAGAITVAKGLKRTMKLTQFDLSNNNINEEAVDDIATVLFHNTTLQVLELANNNLQSVDSIKIARALCNTVTLTSVSLSFNRISEKQQMTLRSFYLIIPTYRNCT